MLKKIHKKVSKMLERKKMGCNLTDFSRLAAPEFIRVENENLRLNLLISTIDASKMYGGLTTALNFYKVLLKILHCDGRIIVMEDRVQLKQIEMFEDSILVSCEKNVDGNSVCELNVKNGYRDKLAVRERDIFLATHWVTCYPFAGIRSYMINEFGKANPLLYLIQDFEPGFHPWSSEYFLAESTYKIDGTIAIFNSKELCEYVNNMGYTFYDQMYFEPKLNEILLNNITQNTNIQRKHQLIIYGRPNNQRNAFTLIISALNYMFENYSIPSDWEFISIGAYHKDIPLYGNNILKAKGKLTLEEYSCILAQSSVGLSLMCSPHPSYPPLEMATCGVYTITNSFLTKNLTEFSKNIISLPYVNIQIIAEEIFKAIKNIESGWEPESPSSDYMKIENQFDDVVKHLKAILQ